MYKFTLIFLITLTCLVSCLPYSKTSEISFLPNIQDEFGENSERVLVLPVWEKYPLLMARGLGFCAIGDPLFLTVQDLTNLHNIIPSKTSVGLMGINAAIGKTIFFNGAIIISESGRIVTIHCENTTWKTRCEKLHADSLNQQWRDNIVQIFKKPRGRVTTPTNTIAELIYNPSYPNNASITDNKFKMPSGDKEIRSIITFLNNIKL